VGSIPAVAANKTLYDMKKKVEKKLTEERPELVGKLKRRKRIKSTKEKTPPYIPPGSRNQSGYIDK